MGAFARSITVGDFSVVFHTGLATALLMIKLCRRCGGAMAPLAAPEVGVERLLFPSTVGEFNDDGQSRI